MSALFHSYLCGRYAAEWLINMKIRRIILSVAAVLLLCTAVSAADYTDVSDMHWAYQQINYLDTEITGWLLQTGKDCHACGIPYALYPHRFPDRVEDGGGRGLVEIGLRGLQSA